MTLTPEEFGIVSLSFRVMSPILMSPVIAYGLAARITIDSPASQLIVAAALS